MLLLQWTTITMLPKPAMLDIIQNLKIIILYLDKNFKMTKLYI